MVGYPIYKIFRPYFFICFGVDTPKNHDHYNLQWSKKTITYFVNSPLECSAVQCSGPLILSLLHLMASAGDRV